MKPNINGIRSTSFSSSITITLHGDKKNFIYKDESKLKSPIELLNLSFQNIKNGNYIGIDDKNQMLDYLKNKEFCKYDRHLLLIINKMLSEFAKNDNDKDAILEIIEKGGFGHKEPILIALIGRLSLVCNTAKTQKKLLELIIDKKFNAFSDKLLCSLAKSISEMEISDVGTQKELLCAIEQNCFGFKPETMLLLVSAFKDKIKLTDSKVQEKFLGLIANICFGQDKQVLTELARVIGKIKIEDETLQFELLGLIDGEGIEYFSEKGCFGDDSGTKQALRDSLDSIKFSSSDYIQGKKDALLTEL